MKKEWRKKKKTDSDRRKKGVWELLLRASWKSLHYITQVDFLRTELTFPWRELIFAARLGAGLQLSVASIVFVWTISSLGNYKYSGLFWWKRKREGNGKKKNHRQMTAVGVSSFLNLVINAAFVLKRRRFITTRYTYICHPGDCG